MPDTANNQPQDTDAGRQNPGEPTGDAEAMLADAVAADHGDNATSGDESEKAKPDARKIDDLPGWAQSELRRARNEAITFRKQLKEAKQATDDAVKAKGPSAEEIAEQTRREFAEQIGKALGIVEDEQAKEVDPQQVIHQLTAEKDSTAKERDAERDRHRRALIELAVHRASGKHGADPDALLDSRSFLNKIRDLDPDADDFNAQVTEVITVAVEDNPKFRAAAQAGPPAKSGGEFTGGPGGRSGDPESMTIDDFRKQRRRRRQQQED